MGRRKPRIAKTVAELGRLTKVDGRTARRWVAAGCPRLEDGRFDVDAVAAWAAARRSTSARRGPATGELPDLGTGRASTGLKLELDREQVRRKQLQNVKLEVEAKRLQGSVVAFAAVQRMLVTRAAEFKRGLLASRRRICSELPREVQRRAAEVIDREHARLLRSYSRQEPGVTASDDGDAGSAAS